MRSVRGFLRIAHAIWYILVNEFLVLAADYFDDCVVLGTEEETKTLTGCVELFFKMI